MKYTEEMMENDFYPEILKQYPGYSLIRQYKKYCGHGVVDVLLYKQEVDKTITDLICFELKLRDKEKVIQQAQFHNRFGQSYIVMNTESPFSEKQMYRINLYNLGLIVFKDGNIKTLIKPKKEKREHDYFERILFVHKQLKIIDKEHIGGAKIINKAIETYRPYVRW